MADSKISALTAKTSPSGSEEAPINDAGTTKKITLSNIVTLAPYVRRFRSGAFTGPNTVGNLGSTTPTLNEQWAVPFLVPITTTFDRIGLEVLSATATSVIRLGIYNDNGNGFPSTVVLDAGTINGNSATFQTITISQQLTAGLYWVSCCPQTATTSIRTFTAISLGDVNFTNYGGNAFMGFKQSGISGAFASWGAESALTAAAPYIVVRAQ